MNEVKTDVFFSKEDLGKNLYKKKTYYTLELEQEVLAKNKDEADQLFLDGGGIDYDEIKTSITDENKGVATSYVDANYAETGDTQYVGKVAYDEDDYFSEEDGNVIIDSYKDEMTVAEAVEVGQKLKKEKEESDVDIALNLEAESAVGK
tara:strand:- start:12802 stop:13248 length:447 start_codon:yes stop_codon:yes gene_type:complete